jgi:hypothetical protein
MPNLVAICTFSLSPPLKAYNNLTTLSTANHMRASMHLIDAQIASN